MTLAFILSMPNRASWNGRWSGDGDIFALTKRFASKKAQQQAKTILTNQPYSYDFGDGWRASVEVLSLDANGARTIRRKSKGFCGYDWMVGSILNDGNIYGPMRPKPETKP